MEISISKIHKQDDPILAKIIRDSLTEFNANVRGTVYFDASTDHLSELFREAGSIYYVAKINKKVVGGAGVFPTKGLPFGVSELVKMYLLPEARGLGIGKNLILRCIKFAKNKGDHSIYLETLPELNIAVEVYRHMGFKNLPAPLGDSKHSGCSLWMIKEI